MIITALKSLSGQIMVVFLAATAAWGWLKMHDRKIVQEERARVEAKSNQNAQKADAARRSASKLPPDRLRDKWCRDC